MKLLTTVFSGLFRGGSGDQVDQLAAAVVEPVLEAPAQKNSGAARRPRRAARSTRMFAGAERDNLTYGFIGTQLSVNEELRRSLRMLRARSRKLCMDNDYAKKFLHMVKANVIGSTGINLQCQFERADGTQDAPDNQFVEGHWREYTKKKNCAIDGRQSFRDMQALAIETIARDGEVLIQKIRRKDSRYGIQLRILECDHLDIDHNIPRLQNGNKIVMGVELDAFDRAVAYWLTDSHPGDRAASSYRKRNRIPAEQMLHIFIVERPGQVRGIPWMHTAIRRLNMMGGYEEAELVAARVGASKMGFYISPEGDAYGADEAAPDGSDLRDSELVAEAEPGTFEQLPEGVTFETFDPQHPTSAFADFTKAVIRGAASGLNVAYNSLSNDLEGVNFSSIRSGVLEEREQWRQIQAWLAEQMNAEVYDAWLIYNVDFGALSALPSSKVETKYNQVVWQPRGWQWVDPAKDTKSNVDEYLLGTTTLQDIARAKGKDLRDIFKQRRAELDLADEFGIVVGQVAPVPVETILEDIINADESQNS